MGEGAPRIYLLGFMGAGKTSVGRVLARDLEMEFVDLDREIESAADASVARLFAERGEDAFRRLESKALHQAASEPPAVIATGGGIVTRPDNLDRMAATGRTVWLHPSFDTVVERLTPEEVALRPLFESPDAARELYRERLGAYRRADHEVIIGAHETPEDISRRIRSLLGEGRCVT